MSEQLRVRELQIMKAATEGKSIKEIMAVTGLKRGAIYQTLKRPTVKTTMQRALQFAGLTDKIIAHKFKDLLDAKRPMMSTNGMIDVDDNQTQLRAAVEVCKLKNAYPVEQLEQSVNAAPISIEIRFVNADVDTVDVTPRDVGRI